MPRSEGLRVLLSRSPHEQDFLRFAALPRTGLFLDLGAHGGQSAASFHLVQPRWRILSFEADPRLRWSLALTALALRGRMRFRMQAVGRRRGMATLHVPRAGARLEGEATLTPEVLSQDPPTRARLAALAGGRPLRVDRVRVPVVRIDDLDLRPDAVKLDLQGGELDAVQGMLGTLARHRPALLMENNPHSHAVVELLEPLGYRVEDSRVEDLNLWLVSGR